MARPIEEPVIETYDQDRRHETKTTHPAFAQIGAFRTSGGNTALFGSDFNHNAYMTIRIGPSALHRTLSRDWHHGERLPYIEVALSEAQWATFVSAPNVGDGVPCTLQSLNGKTIPGLPDPTNRSDQFREEVKAKLDKSVQKVVDTIAKIDGLGLPKGKAAAAKEGLNSLLTELNANLPFVAKMFEEHMEDTVEAAKQEVHGYMTHVLQRAGIEAITGGQLPLQIEQRKDD